MPGRPVRQGLSDGIGRGAKPFHLAVTLGPVAAPQTGVIVSLSRENVSPAEITSANFPHAWPGSDVAPFGVEPASALKEADHDRPILS